MFFFLDSDECAFLGRHDHDVEKNEASRMFAECLALLVHMRFGLVSVVAGAIQGCLLDCARAFRPCVGSCGGDSMMRVTTIGSLVHSRFALCR